MSFSHNLLLGISGSLRAGSTNHVILNRIGDLLGTSSLSLQIYERLAAIPAFDPGLDSESPPKPVADLRLLIEQSEGLVVCTPEYVFGPPGSLKNALDWMVSTTLLLNKPTALVVASTVGEKTFESLLFTLRTLGCDLPDERALLISGVNAKVNKSDGVHDAGTLAWLRDLVGHLEIACARRG